MSSPPKFGHHFEICFSVDNLSESIKFYQNIGFEVYTGGPDKGWCTVTDGMIYLALFADKFIEKEFGIPVLFNYRGGNTQKIVNYLKEKGMKFSKENPKEDGTGDAIMKDINGRVFYFDTSPDEDRIDIEDID